MLGGADYLIEVPPFGARGGNSGIADAFNLSWKLAGVMQGRYSKDLLLTYEAGKTMRFLVPQTPLDREPR